ncbi:restriction endonuclease subunit S [Bifidobacterium sp. 82T24]|uniref:restriction endonuclease subunit S n=1 Tax=Bifidobacterium pluvialisilvae TaxID=2834436 RepID=UPI001C575A88|nr:restriction endonuclease subunit S [Bifidobacterium pluvialisilvae]MBW3088905.1 restriction endonuclease subunit S [Bifidobacterium pluvialisilvae]
MTHDDGIDAAQATKPAPSNEGAVERSETEGGRIPMVKLGDVATIRRDVVDPGEVDVTTAYLGLEDIERGGRILQYRHVVDSGLTSSKFAFSKTDLLYGKLRPNLGKIAKPERDGICSTDILPIVPGESLHRDFLGYYLSQPKMVAFAASRTSGANLPRISPKTLLQIPVPLPPLSEQRRIVAILDRADAIRTKRRQVLDALDELPRSLFAEMFGDPVLNPKGWNCSPLSNLGAFKNGLNFGKGETGCELKVIGVGDFGSRFSLNTFDDIALVSMNAMPSQEYLLKDGDILFVRSNGNKALVGRSLLVYPGEERVSYGGFCIRFRLNSEDRLLPLYLNAVLQSKSVRQHVLGRGRGSNIANLNQKMLQPVRIPLPPLSLQHEFAEKVAAIEDARRKVERALELDEELFGSLQSRVFRGGI